MVKSNIQVRHSLRKLLPLVRAYILFKVDPCADWGVCQKILDIDEVLTFGIVYVSMI